MTLLLTKVIRLQHYVVEHVAPSINGFRST